LEIGYDESSAFHTNRTKCFNARTDPRQKCAILYTIVENCRRLGINPKEYLTDVLSRLPGMLAKDAITLTPANWLKVRSGKAVRKVA
jgi:IS66 C-terminal element